MTLRTLFLEEFEEYIVKKYWEKDDNGKCWNILPIELVQQIYKTKLLVELVTRNIRGAEIFWDDPHNPMLEIYDKIRFNHFLMEICIYYQIDIFMYNYNTICFAGQHIKIEE